MVFIELLHPLMSDLWLLCLLVGILYSNICSDTCVRFQCENIITLSTIPSVTQGCHKVPLYSNDITSTGNADLGKYLASCSNKDWTTLTALFTFSMCLKTNENVLDSIYKMKHQIWWLLKGCILGLPRWCSNEICLPIQEKQDPDMGSIPGLKDAWRRK